ncbi:MAG: hypothetical protein R3356_03210 [Eudoraea sp.]|nr:hypothetical protein [Eudoraea sp.]
MSRLKLYSIYHLNLAYSSIDINRHEQVIQRCYWPLLSLAEKFPIAIELTAYTLECVEAVDPSWCSRLKTLIAAGKVELIASGDSQIIAPLVPAEVTEQNLRLGINAYKQRLGVEPGIAFINEQAYSRGTLDLYAEAGFKAIVMEWNNPFNHHADWKKDWCYFPQQATGLKHTLPVIWNKSIAFQKFQRYAHGELILDDYLEYLFSHIQDEHFRAFSMYGNDAEIFDFRPGRFHTEAVITHQEWQRIDELYQAVSDNPHTELVLPSQVLDLLGRSSLAGNRLDLAADDMPIPVKKQRKYNLSRWAVTGRDDLGLNTLCFRQYKKLINSEFASTEDEALQWQQLCRCWASDYRTHITEQRWEDLIRSLPQGLPLASSQDSQSDEGLIFDSDKDQGQLPETFDYDRERHQLQIQTENVQLTLNLFKGLSIESLAFAMHDFVPTVGTLHHGEFDSIELGADFFTAMSLIEVPENMLRITDLQPVSWQVFDQDDMWCLKTCFETSLGSINKNIKIHKEQQQVILQIDPQIPEKPRGSYRMQHITFLPQSTEEHFNYACHNGGKGIEQFSLLDSSCLHGTAVSSMISSSTGLGATQGKIIAGYDKRQLLLSWDPAQSAVFPMIHHACHGFKHRGYERLARVIFSMGEIDETTRQGGSLEKFSLRVEPK